MIAFEKKKENTLTKRQSLYQTAERELIHCKVDVNSEPEQKFLVVTTSVSDVVEI